MIMHIDQQEKLAAAINNLDGISCSHYGSTHLYPNVVIFKLDITAGLVPKLSTLNLEFSNNGNVLVVSYYGANDILLCDTVKLNVDSIDLTVKTKLLLDSLLHEFTRRTAE